MAVIICFESFAAPRQRLAKHLHRIKCKPCGRGLIFLPPQTLAQSDYVEDYLDIERF